MSDVTRWDPFKELDDLQTRLNTLFGRAPLRREVGREEAIAVAEWAPVVDILEDQKGFLIKVDLTEVRREDVKVTVQDEVLTISGERQMEKYEGRKYHRVERPYGRFTRSFSLPEEADSTKVSADFKDGVLRVHLPKAEKAKPKSIEVKVG